MRITENRYFTLQWHLTAKCPNSCAHCYLQDSDSYLSEIENELAKSDCLKVIDDFYQTTRAWKMPGRINFTGGDPLLKSEIFDLIKYSSNKGINVGMLGNPEYLDYETARKLKGSGLKRYQISIDGLEETHDKIRSRGSFKRTVNSIGLLNRVGIKPIVMFTLSKSNVDEIIPVIKLVAENNVAIFDFARLVATGNGARLKEDMLQPKEYRDLLLKILVEYKRLKEIGCKTHFGRKENLWKLLYQELGLLPCVPKDETTIFDGCDVGISILTVLADGTVYSCRRLPIQIGKVPDESLRDIFISSSVQNEMREVKRMEKCSNCDLLQYCRGCPAVAYAVSGNFFAADPQCWKES